MLTHMPPLGPNAGEGARRGQFIAAFIFRETLRVACTSTCSTCSVDLSVRERCWEAGNGSMIELHPIFGLQHYLRRHDDSA